MKGSHEPTTITSTQFPRLVHHLQEEDTCSLVRAHPGAIARTTPATSTSMSLTTKASASTEEDIEHIEKHTKQESEQLWVKFRARMDRLRLDAEQQRELEAPRPPAVTATINDLPTEVIYQILKYLKPPPELGDHDQATFYNSLEVCRQWRTIGMELVFNRSTQGWSQKRWSMMSIVLKHIGARLMKQQAQSIAWNAKNMDLRAQDDAWKAKYRAGLTEQTDQVIVETGASAKITDK